MKPVIALGKFSIAILLLISCMPVSAQQTDKQQEETAKKAAIDNMLKSKRFEFVAQSAVPMRGNTRQLSFGYHLTVLGDSLLADLPYYGRSHSAGYGGADGPIHIKSNQYTYQAKETKKEGWEVTIVPKSVPNVYQITISISALGNATAYVKSNSRDNISFYGTLKPLP